MTRWVLGSGVVASPGQGSGVPPCPQRPLTCPHSSPVSRVVYNGKRNSGPRSPPTSSEIFTPAHEENVRFIYEGARGAPTSPEPLLPFAMWAPPHCPPAQAGGVMGPVC